MKYFTFYRENNNFDDLLSDQTIKKAVDEKILWYKHLILGFSDTCSEQTISYLTIKYGDEMVRSLVKDFSPKPGIDYIPKPPENYKQIIS